MKWLENDTIRLRALEPEDLDLLYAWENDTSLWEFGSTLVPYSRYVLKAYLEHADADIYAQKQLRLMIVLKASGETVGTVDLFDFDPRHRRAGVGILVDPAHQRKGIGKEALSLLTAYAFGFTSCGILKDWLHTNHGFADAYFMTLLNKKA